MLNKVIPLSLVGLASAVPLTSRQVPHYPPTAQSTGFRLIANVTVPSQDFTPPVNNWVLDGIHVGPGLNDAVLSADGDNVGRIFYQNGTAEQIRFNEGSTVTDGGTPLYPYGISVQAETTPGTAYGVSVNGGEGTTGVQLTQFPDPYPILRGGAQGTYVACNEFEPYYQTNYTTVRFTYDVINPDTALYEHDIPEGCIAINLVPECAVLPDLPAGSVASHEFASTVNCYSDVSAIDWTQYGP